MNIGRLLRRIGYAAFGLAMSGGIAAAALSLSTGANFLPGPRLIDGSDLNVVVGAVNTLQAQAAGTTAGAYTGTFNGIVGGTTPAAGTFTTLTSSGAYTPTGGVAAAGGFTISPRNVNSCGAPAYASTDGNDSTPVATEVYISEIFVPANMSVTGIALFNGSVASGNLKAGLADSTGAIVATSVSTAMSGTDTYQLVPFTVAYSAKGPATYYALEFVDNNTARYNALPVGHCGAAKQTGQTYATGFTTITPPTTFTANLGAIAGLY